MNKKLKISVLGSQASGKGTQAYILSITTGVPAISVGNLLRDAGKQETDQGKLVRDHLAKGTFPPEVIVLPIIKNWLDKHPAGWVIDGFPRTLEQARQSADFFKPDVVLFLELPDEEAKRRIFYRRVCAKCRTGYNIITQPPRNDRGVCDVCGGELVRRPDDTPELVEARLKTFHELTEPLKQLYLKKGNLIVIDGRQGIKEVAHEIEQRLAAFRKRGLRMRSWQYWIIAGALAALSAFAMLVWIGANG